MAELKFRRVAICNTSRHTDAESSSKGKLQKWDATGRWFLITCFEQAPFVNVDFRLLLPEQAIGPCSSMVGLE